MSPEPDVTLGELSRSIIGMEKRMSDGFAAVNQRLDSLQYVPRTEHDLALNGIREDVRSLEEKWTWMTRALVASFLFPLAVAVVVAVVVAR